MVSRAAELLQPQGDANGVAEGALGARCGTLVKTPIAEPKGFFSRRLDLSKTRVGKRKDTIIWKTKSLSFEDSSLEPFNSMHHSKGNLWESPTTWNRSRGNCCRPRGPRTAGARSPSSRRSMRVARSSMQRPRNLGHWCTGVGSWRRDLTGVSGQSTDRSSAAYIFGVKLHQDDVHHQFLILICYDSSNKCHASSNKCLTSSNKKLLF